MPKQRRLDAEYTDWMSDLPEEVRTTVQSTFEKSDAYKRLAGLNALATQSAQQAAQARAYASEWEKFNDANPILKHWDQVGPMLQMHTPHEAIRRLQPVAMNENDGSPSAAPVQLATVNMREMQTKLAQLSRMRDADELTWEEFTKLAAPLTEVIQSQQSQIEQMHSGMSEFSKFRNETIPQYAAGITATLQESNRAVASRLAEMQKSTLQTLRYAQQHPDRDVEEIAAHAQEQSVSFLDAAQSLYGADDQEAVLGRRIKPLADKNKELEERLARFEQQAGGGGPGGSPMVPPAIGVFTRPGRRQQQPQQPRPVARTDGEVRENIISVLGRTAA